MHPLFGQSEPTRLHTAKRIVVKFGSSILVNAKTGEPNREYLLSIARNIQELLVHGAQVLIVTSGAVAIGRRILGLDGAKMKLEEKQAAAATGQVALMQAWQAALAEYNIKCAQSLLTAYDTERRRNWLNARATFDALFTLGVVPIVNENDTVATSEIRYGDNDRLAARVAQMIGADCLILFSDIDGLYDKNPRQFSEAKHIDVVGAITPAIEAMAGEANAAVGMGSGGMRTKIEAAIIATSAGCAVAICDGRGLGALARLGNHGKATWFEAATDPKTARHLWLAHNLRPQGTYVIDKGAVTALLAGASLLPIGVVSVEGNFERGDAVAIKGKNGKIVGRGISAYSSGDAGQIIGVKSEEIERILGFSGRPALVHRDDMVVGAIVE
ncbi:MAG: glutamate 5-kinase [Hyphomonadaceae bacterium]|nr:MAG: glutamate 5-kinase [Hyphomonadaceae bacterium]